MLQDVTTAWTSNISFSETPVSITVSIPVPAGASVTAEATLSKVMLANVPGRAKASIFSMTGPSPGQPNTLVTTPFGVDGPPVLGFTGVHVANTLLTGTSFVTFGLELAGAFNFAVASFKLYIR
jgi:hypothetical protein